MSEQGLTHNELPRDVHTPCSEEDSHKGAMPPVAFSIRACQPGRGSQ